MIVERDTTQLIQWWTPADQQIGWTVAAVVVVSFLSFSLISSTNANGKTKTNDTYDFHYDDGDGDGDVVIVLLVVFGRS